MKLYVDIDGVLVDTYNWWKVNFNRNPTWDDKDFFGETIKMPNFWSDIPWDENGLRLWDTLSAFSDAFDCPLKIISRPASDPSLDLNCYPGKIAWVKKNLPEVDVEEDLILTHNKSIYAGPESVLIDDEWARNLTPWSKNGGLIVYFDVISNPDVGPVWGRLLDFKMLRRSWI